MSETIDNKKSLIKVKGKQQIIDKVEKNQKTKSSNFFLTINTNQQYGKDAENLQNDLDVFEDSVKEVLNNIDQYITLPAGVLFNEETIKDVDVEYVIEVGGKKHQIHTHIIIRIDHYTNVQLDYNSIKQKIKNDLGLDNLYVNNKLIRNRGFKDITEYLNKYT